MKTSLSPRASSRMSIEVFDPKLLKELKLLNTDDFNAGEESIDDDSDETELGFTELNFDEFEKTLY